MNRTGCPDGWATDTVIYFVNSPLACDLSIPTWIFFGALLTLMKLFIAIGYSYLWLRREFQHQKKPNAYAHNRKSRVRRPIIPIVAWIMYFTYIGFFISSFIVGSDGVPNFGVPLFFFGLGWALFSLGYFVYLKKFIKLGHKIVSRSRSVQWAQIRGIDTLTSVDTLGKINLLVILLCLLGQTMALCIVGLILPHNYIVVQVGAGLQGWFNLQTAIAIVHQFQRVRNVILDSIGNTRSQVSAQATIELEAICKRVRSQQMAVVAATAVSGSLYFLIAAEVIFAQHFIILILMSIDPIILCYFLFTNYCRKSARAKDTGDTGTTGENNNPSNPKVNALANVNNNNVEEEDAAYEHSSSKAGNNKVAVAAANDRSVVDDEEEAQKSES